MKKLITFGDETINKVEDYAKKEGISFTQAVRILVEIGLNRSIVADSIDQPIAENPSFQFLERLEKLEADRKWWNTDDIQSRIGNIEVSQKDIKKKMDDSDKRINILTSVSKMFKGHLNNRSIHLQD